MLRAVRRHGVENSPHHNKTITAYCSTASTASFATGMQQKTNSKVNTRSEPFVIRPTLMCGELPESAISARQALEHISIGLMKVWEVLLLLTQLRCHSCSFHAVFLVSCFFFAQWCSFITAKAQQRGRKTHFPNNKQSNDAPFVCYWNC